MSCKNCRFILVIFWISSHSKVIFIHFIESCISIPSLIKVDIICITLEYVFSFCSIVTNTIISTVSNYNIFRFYFSYFFHLIWKNRPDYSISISCRSHVYWFCSCKDKSLFNRFVTVSVNKSSIFISKTCLENSSVRT